jgi:hypothetical protein
MHYIKELVTDRIINLQYYLSSEQDVDIFTKTFTDYKFHFMHGYLGVKDTIFEQLSFLSFHFDGAGGGYHEVFPLSFFLVLIHYMNCKMGT